MISFSLLTALVLNRKIAGRGFFRAAFFYPVLLSPVVVALIWKWILQRNGVLNAAHSGVRRPGDDWLIHANWAFFWTVFVSIWAHMGFYTLILLAGLQAIPADIYEAAAMDAASPWRTFRRLTLPLLMPSLLVVFILAHDPRRADLRRGLCADRRRSGNGDHLYGAVHLPDRLRAGGAAIRAGRGGLAAAGGGAAGVHAVSVAHNAAGCGHDARMLTARRGRAGWDWTDWASYVYLVLGVILMFGPVLWLASRR